VTSVEAPRIERIRAGNEAEFEELFHGHYAALCAFAYRFTGSSSAAEEIVQGVFVDLWERRERLAVHTSLRAYLYAATRNRALDARKHEQVEARWAEQSWAEDDFSTQPDSDAQLVMEANEASEALHAAIAKLPERARLIVTLRWLRGLKPPEIAEAIGISLKGVEIQITRALRALRIHLERERG
jgi:RNA polymerase sigma-70 factor (ECF subfamily)